MDFSSRISDSHFCVSRPALSEVQCSSKTITSAIRRHLFKDIPKNEKDMLS